MKKILILVFLTAMFFSSFFFPFFLAYLIIVFKYRINEVNRLKLKVSNLSK